MFMGNGARVQVVYLEIIRLHLNIKIKNKNNLQNVAFIPSIRRNLTYVSILDRLGNNFLWKLKKLIYIETLY